MNKLHSLNRLINEDSNKYFIRTYGCQMNEHDSEQIAFMLNKAGFKRTEDIDESDLIILNTCSIRANAENKVYGLLGQLKKYKKDKNNNKIIAICGCMPQRESSLEELTNKYENIDIIFGTNTIHKFPELLLNYINENRKEIAVRESFNLEYEVLGYSYLYSHKAFVNIMYGCNNFCTYCIVPFTRGREVSRPLEEIITEVKKLAKNGVKEITLLGQNVNSYGNDFDKPISFSELLKELDKIEGIEQIRFMTSHPKDISDKLIQSFQSLNNLERHLHLPVQSGSNRILKEMNRTYSREKYIDIVNKTRKLNPDISITTDIMVGFPGETEEDFEETLDLVRICEFESAFTFIYSPREGTKAAKMENFVDKDIINDRFKRLTDLLYEIALKKNIKLIGSVQRVLVDEISKTNDEYLNGRTSSFLNVNFKGEKDLIGKFVNVKIIDANTFALEGEIIDV
ncbi:MAG: tRNA (N6-isopentenyl adenosine(37)-C2)-methylthiotransferase MiaB [Tissierellia bacterium]|nr:tRNA (N6-isopentenyl adenosine(37)-C2)-methylthiotransferase MiaB [Tissierellia bacterium]